MSEKLNPDNPRHAVAIALKPHVPDGAWILVREPFRWKRENAAGELEVVSNHYDGADAYSLAQEFNYDVLHNFGDVIVVRHAPTYAEILLAIRRKIRDLAGKIADYERDASVPPAMTERLHHMHLAEVALVDADTMNTCEGARRFLVKDDFYP
jgi:hypothetical protein